MTWIVIALLVSLAFTNPFSASSRREMINKCIIENFKATETRFGWTVNNGMHAFNLNLLSYFFMLGVATVVYVIANFWFFPVTVIELVRTLFYTGAGLREMLGNEFIGLMEVGDAYVCRRFLGPIGGIGYKLDQITWIPRIFFI